VSREDSYKIQVFRKPFGSTVKQKKALRRGRHYATFHVALVIDRVCITVLCGRFCKIYGCFVW